MNIGEKSLEIMTQANWYNRWLFSYVKPHLGKRILEIGSGTGNITKLLADGKRKVIACDIEEKYLIKLRSELKKRNLKVVFGNIEKKVFNSKYEKFDTTVCLNVLEHIKNDKRALKNIWRSLKLGGNLILLIPAHALLFGTLDKELGHYRRYSKVEVVTRLEKVGFRTKNVRHLNPLGMIGWFINSRILKKRIVSKRQVLLFDILARPFLLLEKALVFPFGLSLLVIAKK